MKTSAEIHELIRQWKADPCWDIEDTDGFEEHRAELQAIHEEYLAECAADRQAKLVQKADELGVPGNLKLAKYVMDLEMRLDAMNGALENVYFSSHGHKQESEYQWHLDW